LQLLQSKIGFCLATILYHLGYLVLYFWYDATTSQGYFNADGSLLLATNGVSRLTLNSTGATFASSVTANSLAITTAPTSNGTPQC
jgi:hypothetical protein